MSNRLVWADSLKGILILLVILGHCIANFIGNEAANKDYIWCLIYSFHMPAFIAISGFLSFRKNKTPNKDHIGLIVRRFLQLLVPFFAWSAVFYIINKQSLLSYYNCIIYPTETYWFLWALFFIVAIFTLSNYITNRIDKIKHKEEILLSIICLSCAGIMVIFKDIKIFGIQYILYYFIFYCIGWGINKFNIITRNKWIVISLFLLWFILGSFWKPNELPTYLNDLFGNSTAISYIYKFIVALIAVIVLFCGAPYLLNKHNCLNSVLCSLGSVSLGLYVCHMTYINKLSTYIKSLVDSNWLTISASFILITIASFGIVVLLQKWKWTSRIFLGKY